MIPYPEILETVVLGPEDRLVIVLPETTTPEIMKRAIEATDARGWGERVLFVAGVEQLAVIRAEVVA